MQFKVLVNHYRYRVSEHPLQELLAGLGIAVGVALVFAVQIANNSIVGSASEIASTVTGTANLQLVSRDGRGFEESKAFEVAELPGIEKAAPLLQQRAVLGGPGGKRVAVEIASADPSLIELTSGIDPRGLNLAHGLVLPDALWSELGLPSASDPPPGRGRARIEVEIRGRSLSVPVVAPVGRSTIGALADANVAITTRPYLQGIAGLEGRVTRVLVRSEPGKEALARQSLERLADGRLTVASTASDLALLKKLTVPHDQATAFFAAISALAGLLFAFNAMLLTAPERRHRIAILRRQGARRRDIVQLVLGEATFLGIVASAVGLVGGWLLSSVLFNSTPAYLAAAFPLGSEAQVTWQPAVAAALGGVLITWIAAASPLFDLRRDRAPDLVFSEQGEPGHELGGRLRRRLLVAGLMILVATGALLLVSPTAAVIAGVGLGVATILILPALFATAVSGADAYSERSKQTPQLTIAVAGLKGTTLRSLALAATGAVAVFGSVAVGNGHRDLLQGLYSSYWQYADTADLWVVQRSDDLATKSFHDRGLPAAIRAVPGVASARPYYGSFSDIAGQRVWMIGRSAQDRTLIPATEVVEGTQQLGTERLKAGGWLTISDKIAAAEGLEPGATMRLPTPTGQRRFQVGAVTTNLGWTGGAIILNSADYRRAWANPDPAAIEIDVAPGASVARTQRGVQRALERAGGDGLLVQTTRQRADQANALARQALERLGQIAIVLLLAAALAIAAAMGTAIWQRRVSLAALRADGFESRQVRRVLMIENGMVLAIGCLAGAAAGLYGELLATRYLRYATGFPVSFSPSVLATVGTALIVVLGAFVLVALPIWLAGRTPPRLRLRD